MPTQNDPTDYVMGEELIAHAEMKDLHPEWANSIRRLRYIAISREDSLYLDEFGHGDDAKFAGIFRDVWLTIPVEDRKRMTGHWAAPHMPILPCRGVVIRLENLPSMRTRKVFASCGALGAESVFYAPVVDRMPRKHVAALIAHELAHVLQASNGQLTPPERPDRMDDQFIAKLAALIGESFKETERKLCYQSSPVEREADAIAKRWGFNVPAMQRWLKKKDRWDDMPESAY